MKYLQYIGPSATLVTGVITGPVEFGDIRSVEDEVARAMVLVDHAVLNPDDPTGTLKNAQVPSGLWVELGPDEAKEYAVALARAQKPEKKQAIAKPEVVKAKEDQSQQ